MSLRVNVVANYLGQGWRVLMSLVFVPVYIKLLGIEAYGLIAMFAMLQAWLSVLDLGLRPTLVREMARLTVGAQDAQSIRDLLRSVEIIVVIIALMVAAGIGLASGWLANNWLQAASLPAGAIAQAFALMGVVAALQFVESIFNSSLQGLQRQVMQNTVTSFVATLRGIGAVAVLLWVSPTIQAFFMWQVVSSLLSVLMLAGVVYQALPRAPRRATFSVEALQGVRSYAAGMAGITVLALLLTQVDKILLSRLLPLENFAQYALASTVAGVLAALVAPLAAAYYPRFTQLAAVSADKPELVKTYHQAAQMVSVVVGSAAGMLILFGDRVLTVWTQDPALVTRVAPLLAVLTLGSLLNALMWMPYYLQLAHGWTSLTIKTNLIAVALLVPTIIWSVPRYGALGAAWGWVALNTVYVLFMITFMHRRLLSEEKWRWYMGDVVLPLSCAASTAYALSLAASRTRGMYWELTVLFGLSGTVFLAASFASPFIREYIGQNVKRGLRATQWRQLLGRNN